MCSDELERYHRIGSCPQRSLIENNVGSTRPLPMAKSNVLAASAYSGFRRDIRSIGSIETKRGIGNDTLSASRFWAAWIAAWISFLRIVCLIRGCESKTLPNACLSCLSFWCSILGWMNEGGKGWLTCSGHE